MARTTDRSATSTTVNGFSVSWDMAEASLSEQESPDPPSPLRMRMRHDADLQCLGY